MQTKASVNRGMLIMAGLGIMCAAMTLIIVLSGWTDTTSWAWINRDFANYWLASKLVLNGQVEGLFSGHDVYFAHMQQAFGPDYPWHSWSYPPHFLLLIWPFGYLPYAPSMIVFLLVTLVLYLHAATLTLRRYKDFPALLLVPFITCNVLAAQNGFVTAALLLYGLCLRDKRPVLAGIAIGLLTVKPQLGILLPLLLLFERRWSVIASASLTTIAIAALSVWLFGMDAWLGYIDNTWPYQRLVMMEGTGDFLSMMTSPFGALRLIGFPSKTALGVHAVFALMAFALFVVVHFRMKSADDRAANLAFATFLISPYSLVYDLGALVVLSAPLYRTGPGTTFIRVALVTLAATPLFYTFVSLSGVPVTPFVLVGAWGFLIHKALSGN